MSELSLLDCFSIISHNYLVNKQIKIDLNFFFFLFNSLSLILLSSTSMVALGTVLDFLRNKQARCGVYPNRMLNFSYYHLKKFIFLNSLYS